MTSRTRLLVFSSLIFAALCAFYGRGARTQTAAPRRLTFTPEGRTSTNPSVSGDGRRVAFETTGDTSGSSDTFTRGAGFTAVRAYIDGAHAFTRVAAARAPAPSMSQDGSRVVFAAS